jgi:2'-5' RNA ligase
MRPARGTGEVDRAAGEPGDAEVDCAAREFGAAEVDLFELFEFSLQTGGPYWI